MTTLDDIAARLDRLEKIMLRMCPAIPAGGQHDEISIILATQGVDALKKHMHEKLKNASRRTT